MTQKEREDRFIEECRKNGLPLTFEAEMLLRYGYAAGADELGRVAYAKGVYEQREGVLTALGAAPRRKERYLP